MLKLMFLFVVAIFCVIGFIDVIKVILTKLFKNDEEFESVLVIPFLKRNDKAEFILRNVISRVDFLGRKRVKKIICLDTQMDKNTKRICEILRQESGLVEVCSAKDLEEVFKR